MSSEGANDNSKDGADGEYAIDKQPLLCKGTCDLVKGERGHCEGGGDGRFAANSRG